MKDEQTGIYRTNKTFKMSKTFKRLIAAGASKELRDHFKHMAIQAQMSALDVPKKKEKKN